MIILLDVMLLNSLCEMFGLLDSVKQATDLRRSQTEKKKIHNSVYGEKAFKTITRHIQRYPNEAN